MAEQPHLKHRNWQWAPLAVLGQDGAEMELESELPHSQGTLLLRSTLKAHLMGWVSETDAAVYSNMGAQSQLSLLRICLNSSSVLPFLGCNAGKGSHTDKSWWVPWHGQCLPCHRHQHLLMLAMAQRCSTVLAHRQRQTLPTPRKKQQKNPTTTHHNNKGKIHFLLFSHVTTPLSHKTAGFGQQP